MLWYKMFLYDLRRFFSYFRKDCKIEVLFVIQNSSNFTFWQKFASSLSVRCIICFIANAIRRLAYFFVCPCLLKLPLHTHGLLLFYFYWSLYPCELPFPCFLQGFVFEREKVTPAVGIRFKFEKKVFKNSTS